MKKTAYIFYASGCASILIGLTIGLLSCIYLEKKIDGSNNSKILHASEIDYEILAISLASGIIVSFPLFLAATDSEKKAELQSRLEISSGKPRTMDSAADE